MLVAIRVWAAVASAWISLKLNLRDERGATAVEYGIMVALIAAVIILAVTLLGSQINAVFCAVVNALKSVPGVGGKTC